MDTEEIKGLIELCDENIRRLVGEIRKATDKERKQVRKEIDRWLDTRLELMNDRDAA